MGFTNSRANRTTANLFASNAVTVSETGFGGDALIATITEEGTSSTDDVLTDGTGTITRTMTSEDHWCL